MQEEYKIWIVIRADLEMPHGKLAAQVGHAIQILIANLLKDHKDLYTSYTENQSIVKIAVEAKNENQLLRIKSICDENKIPASLIRDAGRTFFKEPTFTVCAFGPHQRSNLPKYLSNLRLYE